LNRKRIIQIVPIALAAAGAFTLMGSAEARNRPNKIIFVPPAELPETARVPGQAMLLHYTGDNKTHLCIEQDHGARLAVFDVSDPAHVKEESSAQIDAPGPFDFVSSLGDDAELIRFRDSQEEAVLDLHKVKRPTIKMVPGLTFQGATERLGADGFLVSNQAGAPSGTEAPDYQVVETAKPGEPDRVYDVKQVRQQLTNEETGTTFLLGADGLYLIRRPAVEYEHFIHEWQLSHPG
jgi:hypothetical protein